MKLSHVLKSVRETQTEKTASAPGTNAVDYSTTSSSGEMLKKALNEALTSSPQQETKQASAGAGPAQDLMKMASEIHAAEHESLVKEANLYGTAVADGFMARLAQYNEAAEKLAANNPAYQAAPSVKTAGADDSFEKFASENPGLVKEAAELGFKTANGQLEKLAEVAYTKGYNEATVAIYKTANAAFIQGFEDVGKVLQNVPNG